VSDDDAEGAPTVQALREARDHLRAVTDSMGEALCTLDDAGHVSYMNPAAERMLGWSLDELRGRTLHEATHYRRPDGSPYPIHDCPLYGGHRAREAVRVEDDMFVRRDGSGVDVSWVLTPFHSPLGASSVVVFSDNTLAKASQQRLQGEIERLSQVRDLHEALQEQRFELFAQPIIDVASGTVVSHELLLRMRERDGGIRTPASFLPVAESCGLIREIDRWVVCEAARLAGDGHRVELNLSATSLGDPSLFEHLGDALTRNDADPSRMVIELTETALMQEEAIARTFIERVRAMGCEVALDDFGTGFGGFAYLKRLPVDYLKIDIEFVRDLCTSAASQHVVKAVVGLAQAFGQRTIAEGVEDDQTLEMVRAMGVDYAQGFGIGCPAPLSETLPDTSSIAAERDHAGVQRDHAGVQRDHAGVQRDLAGVVRDRAGARRDHAGVQRDLAGVMRDRAGAQRDHAAELRDRVAEQSEASPGGQIMAVALRSSARARQEAARDRWRSRQDRRAGASERTEAELDRGTALADRRAGASERSLAGFDRDTALADRGAGASERTEAELDRDTALTNRGASAKERETSSLDALTGAYLRGAGLAELQRDLATARRTEQPLVLAFVDVDHLKSTNDLGGHAAGDRMLLEVANTLRAKLRSHDLIIRYGGDEFVCAIAGLSIDDAAARFVLVNAALAAGPEHGSVTVGLASLRPDDSPEDLVVRADAALYLRRQQTRAHTGADGLHES